MGLETSLLSIMSSSIELLTNVLRLFEFSMEREILKKSSRKISLINKQSIVSMWYEVDPYGKSREAKKLCSAASR